MNTLSIAVLSLFLLTSFHSSSAAAADATPVLDVAGNQLKPGSKYYIFPALFGFGGGIKLSPYPTGMHEQCPVLVSQEPFEVLMGLPVSFHPADSNLKFVPLSKSLNIKFPGLRLPKSCATSAAWQVGDSIPDSGERLIKIGGVEGSPGCSTMDSWFKIEKIEERGSFTYKLVWNPEDVCQLDVMGGEKYEVTVVQESGLRVLMLSKEKKSIPFAVGFVEAKKRF